MKTFIEVGVAENASANAKGEVLENFCQRFLETQGYTVIKRLRLTGAEVDLLAKEGSTGEKILVECKAQVQKIPADVISKLLGNVSIHEYSAGWLISTSQLTKDAEGVKQEWLSKPEESRRKLRIYGPHDLLKRLISSTTIIDPQRICDRQGLKASQAYLILSEDGEFWVLGLGDDDAGVLKRALVYSAQDGSPVLSREAIKKLSLTENSLKRLDWSLSHHESKTEGTLKAQAANIVRVSSGDAWSDYRPSRPEDYVGREQLQDDIFGFLDAVRAGDTRTRLLALRGPSGWGKSSTILKLEARARNIRNRNKYFVYSVDCRAALSARFPELALVAAVKQAVDDGFLKTLERPALGSIGQPLSTESMTAILEQLKAEKKVILLVFDQFEELLYKEELVPIFDEVRRLCDAVDEAQAGLVVGFSWKTDGTIPAEHPAYHLWHSLSDRRKEFSISPFSKREINTALSRFAKELGGSLNPQLSRILREQCQGFPWLLKKLCLHVLEQVRAGADQNELLGRALSIQELFDRDVEAVSRAEHACAKEIARESPADFFRITDVFGDEVVHSLLNKRLVIRSGQKLVIYWDIFRDYLLTGSVPDIPITYIPQSNIGAFVEGILFVLDDGVSTYGAIGEHLNLSEGATDNLLRDLIMIGLVEAQRALGTVRVTVEDERAAASLITEFSIRHVVFREALNRFGVNEAFSSGDLVKLLGEIYSSSKFSEKTLGVYAQKLLGWFRVGGVCVQEGQYHRLLREVVKPKSLEVRAKRGMRLPERFLGEAPPEKVLEGLRQFGSGSLSRGDAERLVGRNSIVCLKALGCIYREGDMLILAMDEKDISASDLMHRASKAEAVVIAAEVLSESAKATGQEIGERVATKLGCDWVDASERRNGGALKRWAKWIEAQG